MVTEIERAKYISFTSYKRNGDPVSLPVWVVPFGGGYAFTTERSTYKVKRVRNNPSVTVQACTFRGKVLPSSTAYEGTAEVLEGVAAQEVRTAVKRKYRVVYLLAITPGEWIAKLRKKSLDPVAIKISLQRD